MAKINVRFCAEISLAFIGCISLAVALTGNWWYDIVGADLTDQGFGANLSIHGGLFRSCGPPLDATSGKTEDCPRFEEVLGYKVPKPLIIGRGLLIASIVIVAMAVFQRCAVSTVKMTAEFYLMALGLIAVTFSLAASFIVSVGILVCNCLDELGYDGWLALVSIFCLIGALIATRPSKFCRRMSRSCQVSYSVITILSFAATIGMLIFNWMDSSAYNTNFVEQRIPQRYQACARKYSLWQFCVGYCDRMSEDFFWTCDDWSKYIDMVGGANSINWKTKVPFGLNVSRLWVFGLLICVMAQKASIWWQSRVRRTLFLASFICAFGAWITMYTFNILESKDTKRRAVKFNETNSATGIALAIFVTVAQILLYIVDTIVHFDHEEKEFDENVLRISNEYSIEESSTL